MIYLVLRKSVAEFAGLPEIISAESTLPIWPDPIRHADSAFTFKDGETIYHKCRYGVRYQYSAEEQLIIALKAVPVNRKSWK